jgi:hypothetical protein
MSKAEKIQTFIIVAFAIACIFIILNLVNNPIKPTNNLQQEQIKLDSVKAFYSKQVDSVNVINAGYKEKIDAKDYIIKQFKEIIKKNNEKINPNNSVPILDSLRSAGFGKY